MKTPTLRETESSPFFAKQHGVGYAFARGPTVCLLERHLPQVGVGPGLILQGLRGDRVNRVPEVL